MGSTIVSLRLCAFARAGSGSICVICGPYEWVQLRRQAATPGQVGGLGAVGVLVVNLPYKWLPRVDGVVVE